jgi:hypothetical protein
MHLPRYLFWQSWQLFLLAGVVLNVAPAWMFFCVCVTFMICMVVLQIALGKSTQFGVFKLRVELAHKHFADCRSLIEGGKVVRLNTKRGKLFVEQVITPIALYFKKIYDQCASVYDPKSQVGGRVLANYF